jgi:hypothetical protein
MRLLTGCYKGQEGVKKVIDFQQSASNLAMMQAHMQQQMMMQNKFELNQYLEEQHQQQMLMQQLLAAQQFQQPALPFGQGNYPTGQFPEPHLDGQTRNH